MHEAMDPGKYAFGPNPAEMYRGWLANRTKDRRSVFLVADPEDDSATNVLAGFLVGTTEREIPIYRIAEFGFLHDLWVEERYRNEGIARQMVTLAVERFREIGVEQIRLDTAAANEPARGLFRTCGFRQSTIEMLIELRPPPR